MKIKNKDLSYEEVCALPEEKHIKPKKPNMFFRTLLKTVSASDLKATNFKLRKIGMEKLDKNEPALFLMNHSSFIDLKIVSSVLYPRPFNIVCTSDGFVGKKWLMKNLGCIPTKKFITDTTLVKDILYTVRTLRSSVLMYPEASYSFDGTATPLPDSLGKLLKMMDVPVIMIKTYGAFARDPLYNMLQLRNVDVSADMTYLLSPEDVRGKSADQLNEILKEQFTFDNFRYQQENNIRINEPFRADGLNRVLYKCPVCGKEGDTVGSGTELRCNGCGHTWTLDEFGFLRSDNGVFGHVPDWYRWERECVREEIQNGTYRLDIPVRISMLTGTDCLYNIGEGRLVHDRSGFHLTGADGKLKYDHAPSASYSLYSDFFWYEIGDMICIGNTKTLYYCFPEKGTDIVAKTRLASEEMFKLSRRARV